jgi:hypothetical protein
MVAVVNEGNCVVQSNVITVDLFFVLDNFVMHCFLSDSVSCTLGQQLPCFRGS